MKLILLAALALTACASTPHADQAQEPRCKASYLTFTDGSYFCPLNCGCAPKIQDVLEFQTATEQCMTINDGAGAKIGAYCGPRQPAVSSAPPLNPAGSDHQVRPPTLPADVK